MASSCEVPAWPPSSRRRRLIDGYQERQELHIVMFQSQVDVFEYYVVQQLGELDKKVIKIY